MTLSPKKRPNTDSNNEFMPVTKRMNLLSIDNSRESTNDSFPAREDENENNAYNMDQQLHQGSSTPNAVDQSQMHQLNQAYSPSLNSVQNPIYYEANRILYEAHQSRVIRMHGLKIR